MPKNGETLRFAFVSRVAGFCADVYAEFLDPVKFDRVYPRDGRRYRLTIERYETVEDTQPMHRAERDIKVMTDEAKDE